MDTIRVAAEWDDEAGVWYVADSNVPGLATEAASAELLMQKLAVIIPELLAANTLGDDGDVPIELVAHRHAILRRAA